MALAFVIIGIIAGAIYNGVSDNGFNKKAGGRLLFVYFLVGCILESIYGNFVGLIFLLIFVAGCMFH